jgi:hypothetical protein
MSARLPTAFLMVAALLLAGQCQPRAMAKPPDLPEKNDVICAPEAAPVAEQPSPPVVQFSIQDTESSAMNTFTPLMELVPLAAPPADEIRRRADWNEGMRTLQRCLRLGCHPALALLPPDSEFAEDGDNLLFELWRNFIGETSLTSMQAGPQGDAGLTGRLVLCWPDHAPLVDLPGATHPADDRTCPYLREQNAPQVNSPVPQVEPCDVLENLDKLEQARRALQRAEFYRRLGHFGAASFQYQAVQRLCPGSRYDELASRRLNYLRQPRSWQSEDDPREAAEDDLGRLPPGCEPFTDEPLTCPYLREQAARKDQPAACPPEAPATVLENLDKLNQAQKAYRRAEACRRKGRIEEARAAYETVRHLCPGSRYDALAGERLRQIQAGTVPPRTGGAAEEQDLAPPPQPPAKLPPSTLEKQLRTPISMSFEDVPLRQIINDIRSAQCLNIILDEPTLVAAGVDLDHRHSIKLDHVSVRSALELLARQSHLAIEIKGDAVLVTTDARWRNRLTTCTYAVGDLVIPAAAKTDEKHQTREEWLIQCITTSIHPMSWERMGGRGTIEYFPLGQSVVVTQTPDVQDQVAELLASLRRLQDEARKASDAGVPATENSGEPPTLPDKAQQLAAMLARYNMLLAQGLYEEAAMCAAQIPDNPVAVAAAQMALAHRGIRISPSEPCTCPSVKPRAMRRPELPRVDAHVAADMDKVLIEVKPSEQLPLAVTVEESGGAEEQEASPACEKPATLFVEPPVIKPAPDCDCCRRWQEVLRQLMDKVRSVACMEVEGPLPGSRARYQIELGCASLRGSWDRDGHGYFELGFAIGTAEPPDLRAAQWAHDDAVTRWIELRGSAPNDPADRGAMYGLEDELWP